MSCREGHARDEETVEQASDRPCDMKIPNTLRHRRHPPLTSGFLVF